MPVPAHKAPEYIREIVAGRPSDFRLHQLLREMSAALKTTQDHQLAALIHTAIGVALAKLGRPEEAVEHHANACRLSSGDSIHANNYAVTLSLLGREEEALHYYVVASEQAGGYILEVLCNLAVSLSRSGGVDPSDVRAVFEEAVSVANPSDAAQTAFLASHAAELGFRDAVVELVARYAAIKFEIPLGEGPPFETLRQLPTGWWEEFRLGYDVACAVAQAGFWSGRVDVLNNAYAAPKTRGSARVRESMDAGAFEATRGSKGRATLAGVAEYIHG